jgi:Superfamily I DNA and RNA helicases
MYCSFLNKNEKDSYWTMADLAAWTSIIKVGDVLKRGARTRIESIMENDNGIIYQPMDQFCAEIFREDALPKALSRNITWLETSLLAGKKTAAEYPINVFTKQGYCALNETPKIIISTIHGVKGGEADVVILFPDLSYKAMQQYDSAEQDQIIRTFYVGMTRARESLILCRPQSGFTVEL